MKKKFLALTMASAVMLMGAGYAYWTDQLTINNTVSTGTFDVQFVNANTGGRTDANAAVASIDGTEWGKYVYSDAYISAHPGLSQADKDAMKTTQTAKSIDAHLGNMYPGSSAALYTTTKNMGTIPAMFDYAKVDLSGSDTTLESKLVYWISWEVKDNAGTVVASKYNQYFADGIQNYEKHLNDVLKGVRLEPDQSLIVAGEVPDGGNIENANYTFRLPTTVVNADNVEGKSVNMNITLNWKQHNAPDTVVGP